MAAALLRRSVATAGLAVLATVASPLVGTAMAVAPDLTAGTFSPADGDTVTANRPAISVAYNTALNKTATTISVTDTSASNAAVPCARAFTPDAATVGCTLSSDLRDNHAYKVVVHAVNAGNSQNARDDSATWTVDIPSVLVASPADGSSVAVAQVLQLTYDEQIDATHSTASVVNGFGTTVPGSVAVVKSSPSLGSNPCPSAACILKFTASQTLPSGTYTARFHADGVTAGVPSASDNPNAFANTVIHFTVSKVKPSIAPQNVVAPAAITQANVSKVPFSGYAQPGFNVSVAIYNETCTQDCPFGDVEGQGPEDGLGTVNVANCEDASAISVNNIRLCPFSLTVDDSNGCDNGASEASCANPPDDPDPGDTADNQWYAFSSSQAGQVPGGASPNTDRHIARDTTGPNPPDSTATGFVTNNSPSAGQATVTVSATDAAEAPTGPDAYIARVNDQFGNSKDVTLAPSAGNLNATFPMPSGIYDGSLTIQVASADSFGNASSFVTANAPPGKSQSKSIVQLAPVDPANHADSMDSSNGSTYDFASLPSSGSPTKVGLPSAVIMHFNEPITLTVPNNDPNNTTPKAHLCVLAPGDICESPLGVGTLTNPSSDRTTLKWVAPDGFGANLPSGTYKIAAFAPAADCPTRQPVGTYPGCETSGGTENDPASWMTLATFTFDKTAPTIQVLTVSPTRITPRSVKSVTVAGTSDPDTRSVQVSIRSSSGGTTRVLSMPVAAPSDPSATSVSWTFFPVDLSAVRDGKLTISAIAVDDAGNTTPAPGKQISATLAAHLSRLTESASSTRITFGKGVLISGRLVDQVGTAIRGATISVRPRFDGGRFGAGQTARTDSRGRWHLTEFPAHNSTWYAAYAGSTASPLHDAAAVRTARTLVRVAIAFTSPRNHATVRSPVVLKGKVGPNKRGSTVSIYRHTSHGNKLLGRVRLDRHSHWSFKLTLRRGTVKLLAVIGRTTGNLGNRTRYLTLTH
jgi:methionine-rich copper-binding protein CopC